MSEELLKIESPWREFLVEVDEHLTAPTRITCIGGFVVTMIHGFSRTTGDLDHVELQSDMPGELHRIAGRGSPLHAKYNLYIDYVGGIVTMPLNFDERLTEAASRFKRLKILIPDVYDLILSKLERNSPKDQADVSFLARKYALKFSRLRERFDVELDFIPNQERQINTLKFWRDWFQDDDAASSDDSMD